MPNKTTKQSPSPILKKRPIRKILLIIGAVILALILLIVGLFAYGWHDYENRFKGGEQIIDKEMAALSLPFGAQTSRNFRDGVCFDNCPATEYTYDVTEQDRTALLKSLSEIVVAHGYKCYEPDTGLSCYKQDGKYSIVILPITAAPTDTITSSVRINVIYSPHVNSK